MLVKRGQPISDGASRDPQHPSRLGVLESVDVMRPRHGTELLVDARDHPCYELAVRENPFELALSGKIGKLVAELGPALPVAHLVQAIIGRDPPDPPQRFVAVRGAIEMAADAKKRFLGRVLGGGLVAQQLRAPPVDDGAVLPVQGCYASSFHRIHQPRTAPTWQMPLCDSIRRAAKDASKT